jgi:tellurite resistance protein TerC
LAAHWIALSVFVVLALAFDLRGGARAAPSLRSAAIWSVVWTVIGIAFAGVLVVWDGSTQAGEYLTGYLIEKSLSLDNLFVFAVLFSFFKVAEGERQRLLVIGIAGAIVLRTIFILLGAAALDTFAWFTYVLGALLLFTAYNIARHGDDEIDPEKTLAMKVLRRRNVSPTVAVVAMIAFFDVMFAIDSIPAIFAITRETFVVFAANAFSLLGLVSLFFVLEGLLARFRYLSQGLAVILAYVGVKILLEDVVHVPEWANLLVVIGALGGAALLSVRRPAAGAAGSSREALAPPTG